MTAGRQRLARWGENKAANWYTERGWEILDRNWRGARGELDLVLRRGDTVVFCEVKTRSNTAYGTAAEAVDGRKQQRIRTLAVQWLRQHRVYRRHAALRRGVRAERPAGGAGGGVLSSTRRYSGTTGTGCGAAWLARWSGGPKVPGSNPGSPTPWRQVRSGTGAPFAPSARAQGVANRPPAPSLRCRWWSGRGRRWPSSGASGEIAPPGGPRRPLPRLSVAVRSGTGAPFAPSARAQGVANRPPGPLPPLSVVVRSGAAVAVVGSVWRNRSAGWPPAPPPSVVRSRPVGDRGAVRSFGAGARRREPAPRPPPSVVGGGPVGGGGGRRRERLAKSLRRPAPGPLPRLSVVVRAGSRSGKSC